MSDGLYNLSKMFEESKLEFLNSLVDKCLENEIIPDDVWNNLSELENEYIARYVHEIETSMEDSEETE